MAINPFKESPTPRSEVSATLGYTTSPFDAYRQGVEIINQQQRAKVVIPLMGSNLDDSSINISSFGQQRQTSYDIAYTDKVAPTPAQFLSQGTGSVSPDPFNASNNNPTQFDSVLEPLTIRKSITRTSTDYFEPHAIRASLSNGGVTEYGECTQITNLIDTTSSISAYVDDVSVFCSASISRRRPLTNRVITPYNEQMADFIYTQQLSGTDMINGMRMGSTSISGTHPHDMQSTRMKRYTPSGFDYVSSIGVGLDALAFGNRRPYDVRSTQYRRDSVSGTRPTIARIGDHARSGRQPRQFDDRNVLIFTSSANVNIGRGLDTNTAVFASITASANTGAIAQVIYPFIGDKKITAVTSGTIVTTGFTRSGVGDVQYIAKQTATGTISFDDSRIDIRTSSFYTTGSDVSVMGLDFRSPLASKTNIVIDLTPRSRSDIFFSTGSAATNVGSGIAYFDFTNRRWAMLGDLSSGSNVDYFNPDVSTRSGSYLAFFPNPGHNITASSNEVNKWSQMVASNVGYVTNEYGFPFSDKFDATSSFIHSMSNYINSPFLLEKITFEFSCSFGGMPLKGLGLAPFQFFILNQYNAKHPTVITQIITGTTPTTVYNSYAINKMKDIVTVAHAALKDATTTTDYMAERDLTISTTAEAPVTGTFIFEKVLGSPKKIGTIISPSGSSGQLLPESVYGRYSTRTNGIVFVRNNVGGRSMMESSASPRSYIASVGNSKASSSYGDPLYSGTTGISPTVITLLSGNHESISPYLLLPTDQLIFGFANQFGIGSSGDTPASAYTESTVSRCLLSILEGKGKLTLYGSLISNGSEYHDTLNQQLTSDAVNEQICRLSDKLDQFSLNNRYLYSGTYTDNVMSGAIETVNTLYTRQVQASSVNSAKCLSGSTNHFAILVDENNVPYSSLTPNPLLYHEANGKFPVDIGDKIATIILGRAADPISVVDDSWWGQYPYENRFEGLRRNLDYKFNDTVDTQTILGSPSEVCRLVNISKYANGALRYQTLDVGSANFKVSPTDVYKAYFGLGNNYSASLVQFRDDGNTTGAGLVENLRGFKYGIFNVPIGTRYCFRRDHHGQLRDMFEQGLDTRFFDRSQSQTLNDAAINVIFSASIDQSSNRSTLVTSSLPYFDGVARN